MSYDDRWPVKSCQAFFQHQERGVVAGSKGE